MESREIAGSDGGGSAVVLKMDVIRNTLFVEGSDVPYSEAIKIGLAQGVQ